MLSKQKVTSKCELIGKYPKELKIKKSEIEDKEYQIKIEYKNIGQNNWNRKYKVELLNNYNENISIENINDIEQNIKPGETYEVNISLKFYSLDEEKKYVLEFILKDEKNKSIVENSKAVINLIIENDEGGNNDDNNHDNDGIEFKGLITNKDFEQLYNTLNEQHNISTMENGNKDLVKIKVEEILEKEEYSNTEKENILSDLKKKIMDELRDEFNGIITNEDFEQLYKSLNEDNNITTMENVNKDLIKIKVKEILKNEDYSGLEKEDIINDLKEKIMDEVFG